MSRFYSIRNSSAAILVLSLVLGGFAQAAQASGGGRDGLPDHQALQRSSGRATLAAAPRIAPVRASHSQRTSSFGDIAARAALPLPAVSVTPRVHVTHSLHSTASAPRSGRSPPLFL
jgi:hypothetical protein